MNKQRIDLADSLKTAKDTLEKAKALHDKSKITKELLFKLLYKNDGKQCMTEDAIEAELNEQIQQVTDEASDYLEKLFKTTEKVDLARENLYDVDQLDEQMNDDIANSESLNDAVNKYIFNETAKQLLSDAAFSKLPIAATRRALS